MLPDDQGGAGRAGPGLCAGAAGWVEHQRQLHQRVPTVAEGVALTGLYSWELESEKQTDDVTQP